MIVESSLKEDSSVMDDTKKKRFGLDPDGPDQIPFFDSWKVVPKRFKSRTAWERLHRRVKKNQRAKAMLVSPRIPDDDEDLDGQYVLNPKYQEENEPLLVTDFRIMLYEESQTAPYRPSARTVSAWDFSDIYLAHARRDDWILEGESGWGTIMPIKHAYYTSGLLDHSTVVSHLNHRKAIGIKNRSGWTRFVLIDLDLHGRDREVFLKMAEILLNKFRGDTWHSIIREGEISGIHLVKVFAKKVSLKTTVENLRQELIRLDSEHPDLAEKCRAAGMPSFSGIEIYPTRHDLENNQNGVRLPMCRGRITITDKYLQSLKTKKGTKAPVEDYVRWLKDPNRQHLEVEKILQTLSTFTFEGTRARRRTPHTKSVANQSWKNRTRARITDFWLDGVSHGIDLNKHIAILARASFFYGHDLSQTSERIKDLVRQLPAAVSQRIKKRCFRQIDKVIETTVDKVYNHNGSQKDIEKSSKIWAGVVSKWQSIGFDPLWPSRIDSKASVDSVSIYWPKAVKSRVIERLMPLTKNPDKVLNTRFVEEFVKLVVSKGTTPWGQAFFRTWVMDRFPGLNLGNNTKRSNVLRALQYLEIVSRIKKGSKARGSSVWELGAVGKQLVGQSTSSLSLGQEQAASPPTQATCEGRGPDGSSCEGIHPYLIKRTMSPSLFASIYLCPITSKIFCEANPYGAYQDSS